MIDLDFSIMKNQVDSNLRHFGERTMHAVFLQFQEILQGSYPRWIWNPHPGSVPDHIPVIMYHSVRREPFESELQFLSSNGYKTIHCDEYYEKIRQGRDLHDRVVLLTFDDGRKSLWSVVYPLLKKYGMKGTSFLIPTIVDKRSSESEILRDEPEGSEKNSDESAELPVTWEECRIMSESGVINFQSHSNSHQWIPVSQKMAGFVTPELMKSYCFRFKIPYFKDVNPHQVKTSEILGAPVYRSRPCLCDSKMYLESESLRSRCVNYVRERGGECFFKHPGWQRELKRNIREWMSRSAVQFETADAQHERMYHEYAASRQSIETNIPGNEVSHLAFPWGLALNWRYNAQRKPAISVISGHPGPGIQSTRTARIPFIFRA